MTHTSVYEEVKAAHDADRHLVGVAPLVAVHACMDDDILRRYRLWLADCAAHVMPEYGGFGDMRALRDAVVVAREYARGRAGFSAAHRVGGAAWDAYEAAAAAGNWRAAWAAEDAFLTIITPDIIRLSLPDVLAKRGAEWAAEHDKWRMSRLLARLSESEPEDFPLPPADAV